MKAIKVSAIVIGLMLVVLTIIGLLLPSSTQVERSVAISGDNESVFEYLNSLEKFHRWSPWAQHFSDQEIEFSGPDSGVGSTMAWSNGNSDTDGGEVTIVASDSDRRVESESNLGSRGRGESYFDLQPGAEDEVQVTWGYAAEHGTNLFARYMGWLTREEIGAEHERGLTELKRLIEELPSIKTIEVEYNVNGTSLVGYVAYPRGAENVPGVLVVHEWWGHNDYVRRRAEMLAELGYAAFALDMYGEGKSTDHPKEANAFMMEVVNNADIAQQRFAAALEKLHDLPVTDPDKTAAIGYCFGGAVVLSMGRSGMPLDGVVSFHGSLDGLAPIDEDEVEADFLVLNGAADPMVTEEQKRAFKEEMNEAGAEFEFVEYPGAKHAFTNPKADELGQQYGLPLEYDAEADADSWQRMQEFLRQVF